MQQQSKQIITLLLFLSATVRDQKLAAITRLFFMFFRTQVVLFGFRGFPQFDNVAVDRRLGDYILITRKVLTSFFPESATFNSWAITCWGQIVNDNPRQTFTPGSTDISFSFIASTLSSGTLSSGTRLYHKQHIAYTHHTLRMRNCYRPPFSR